MKQKLSEIMKEMAQTVLRNPISPSSEAAHAALLFAHIAWNRFLGATGSNIDYKPLLEEFETSNPLFWKELRSDNSEKIIHKLMDHKKKCYPQDSRVIKLCGMVDGKIHVEWVSWDHN